MNRVQGLSVFIYLIYTHILGAVVHVEPEDTEMRNRDSANGRYLVAAGVALVSSIAMVMLSFGNAISQTQAFL